MNRNMSGHFYRETLVVKKYCLTYIFAKLLRFSVICILGSFLLFSACATPNTEQIKNAEAHNKLGYLYLNNNKLNLAFIEFQKAIKLNPKNKEALNSLGYVSARFKKFDEAEMYYKQAISIAPDYSDAMNNLGFVYLDLENWDEAIRYFDNALKNQMYTTPEKAYSGMGYAYYKKGNYLNAEKVLRKSLIRNPVFPRTIYTLGLVYVKLEKYEIAVKEFMKAIGIVPGYIDAHWELAQTYLLMGKKGKAAKHFEVVAEGDVNIDRRREAYEYIRQLQH